jgi:hypothetical protein
MIDTHNVIGFVKDGPRLLDKTDFFGRSTFTVWPNQVAIVDILRLGRAEVEVFGPGIHSVNKAWFAAQEVRLTILSTSEEPIEIILTVNRRIALLGEPTIPIPVSATVRFRLVSHEIERALKGLLERDASKLTNIAHTLRQYIENGFEEVIRSTHLRILSDAKRIVGDRIKSYLHADRRARDDLAIDIIAVDIKQLNLGEVPSVADPNAPFIVYRGPLDLAPNCNLFRGNGLIPELKLEVKPDQVVLLRDGDQSVLTNGIYEMSRPPLNEPSREIIVLSTAHYDLPFTIETRHFFQFDDGTRSDVDISADIVLRYQINTASLEAITFDTATNLLDNLRRKVTEVCSGFLREAPSRALYANIALSQILRDYLLREQPFKYTLAIRVLDAHITAIHGLPELGDAVAQLPVVSRRIESLLDPTGRWLQIPANTVVVIRDQSGRRLLETGRYQFSELDLMGSDYVRIISTEEYKLEVQHTFSPMLSLMGSELPLEVKLTAVIYYRPDLSQPSDQRTLAAIDTFPLDEDLRRDSIRFRVEAAIEDVCQRNALALLKKQNTEISEEIERQLSRDPVNAGLQLRVVVVNTEHPPELYAEILSIHRERIRLIEHAGQVRRKLIDTIADGEGRRKFAERAPPFSLSMLLQPNSDGLRQWCNNALSAVAGLRSGEDMAKAIKVLMESFAGPPQVPLPPPSSADFEQTMHNILQTSEQSVKNVIDNLTFESSPRLESVILTPPPTTLLPAQMEPVTPIEPLPPPIHVEPPVASPLAPALLADVEACRQLAGVRVLPKENIIIIVFDFEDGPVQRLRLVLTDFDDYPDIEPVPVPKECWRSTAEGEKFPIRPRLAALAQWHPGSSLVDVAKEVLQRAGQVE